MGEMAGIRAAEQRRGEALAPGCVTEGQLEGFADRLQTGGEKRARRGSEGVGLSQGSTGSHRGGEGCWEQRPGGFGARALHSLMSEWGCRVDTRKALRKC